MVTGSAAGNGRALSARGLADLPVHLPDYALDRVTVGHVHLGLGAFHRAHQAACVDSLLAREPGWAISAYSWRNTDLPDALAAQDGLYTLLGDTDADPRPRVIGAIRRSGCAGRDPQRFVAEVADPRTRVITLTVTEKAYPGGLDGLDRADPDVAADLAAVEPERSVIGLLTRALAARARTGAGPLAVVSCDNLGHNGAVTATLVGDFTRAHPRYRHEGLPAWLEENVTFPSTVVDRIVPNPDARLVVRVRELTGVQDRATVLGEPYFQWIVEDHFPGPRPPWDLGGARFVTDVEPFEQLKLRVLNGAHTALAYRGLLAGHADVPTAIADPVIRDAVRSLLDDEILPHLPVVAEDVRDYAETVLTRFERPELAYQLGKLGADGSHKIRQRLVPTAQDVIRAGGVPHGVAGVLASWAEWIRRCAFEHPDLLADPLADDLLRMARAVPAGSPAPAAELALRILDATSVLPADLAGHRGFRHSVAAQGPGRRPAMNRPVSVVSIGECMIELRGEGATTMRVGYGGDTANAAIYLAHYGALDEAVATEYLTLVGDDDRSLNMLRWLRRHGVGTRWSTPLDGATSGLYLIDVDAHGERTFVYHRATAAARRLFLTALDTSHAALLWADWVYLSGITLAVLHPAGRRRLIEGIEALRRRGGRVAFDPNYRPRLWDGPAHARGVITEMARRADIVLPTHADERELFGDTSEYETACRLHSLGVPEVVVKLGDRGALVSAAGEQIHVPAHRVAAIDTTAAGDSFNGGYLNRRLRGGHPVAAARDGVSVAAAVVSAPGAIVDPSILPDLRTQEAT